MSRLLGAVLAGGRARRFGSDKAVALLDGVALIDRVLAALGPQVDAVVVCGRAHPGTPSLDDLPAPDLGPLGGLNAALAHAAAHRFDAVVSVGCDLPGLPPNLVAHLGPGPAYIADCPIVGRWPATLAPMLHPWLGLPDGDRSMRGWVRLVGACAIEGVRLTNINTQADLAACAHRMRAYSIDASSLSNGQVANVVSESASA